MLFQGFVNDDMAGDASLAVVNENSCFPSSQSLNPRISDWRLPILQAGGSQKVYGHPFPDARDLPLLSIEFGLFPCCSSEEAYLIP